MSHLDDDIFRAPNDASSRAVIDDAAATDDDSDDSDDSDDLGDLDDLDDSDDLDEGAASVAGWSVQGVGIVALMLAVGSALHIAAILWSSADYAQDGTDIWIRLMLASTGAILPCIVLLVAAVLVSVRRALSPGRDSELASAAVAVGVVSAAATALQILALGVTLRETPLSGVAQIWAYRSTFVLSGLLAAAAFYLVTESRE